MDSKHLDESAPGPTPAINTGFQQAGIPLDEQAALLGMIAHGEPIAHILQAIARRTENQHPGKLHLSIFITDSSGAYLKEAIAHSLPDIFIRLFLELPVSESGMANGNGQLETTSPINISSLPEAIKATALSMGLQTFVAIPVTASDGHIAGIINTWFTEQRNPTPVEEQAIRLAAATTLMAITYLQGEDKRRQLLEREQLAREQINTAEQLTRLAVEGAEAGTFNINLSDGYMVYSPLLSKIMTGQYTPGLTRNKLLEHIHPADKDLRDTAYEAAGRTGQLKYEARFIWHDGSIHWVKVLGTYLPDSTGSNTHFAGIALDITPEVKAREEQQSLLSLVENSADYMAIGDNNGHILYLNSAGRKLLGIDVDADITAYTSKDFYSPEDFEHTRQIIPALLSAGHWCGTVRMLHQQTGELIPCHANFVTIRDRNTDEIIGRGGTLRDLRPEMASRQALEESEQRFRRVIEHAPVAMGVLKGKAQLIEVANDALLAIWGKDKSVIGKPLIEGLPELKGQPFPALIQEVMESGESYYGFETLAKLQRNGQLEDAYFNFVYAPFREGDQITGVQVIAGEVTAQVHAKQALIASEERFRSLVHSAPVPIAIYTGYEMRIQIANEAVLATWNRDTSVIGKTFLEALPEMKEQPFYQLLLDVYMTGIPYVATEEKVYLQYHGQLQLFYFNFTYKPLHDGQGNIYGVINTAMDVTSMVLARQQLKMAEQELEHLVQQRTEELSRANQHLKQSNEELEQFAYVASHDLQEPLRKIRIFSDMLSKQLDLYAVDNTTHNYLAKVIGSAERMSQLIMDLLNFSRIAKKEELLEPVDLNTVLQQVGEDFELMIRQKGATVTIDPLPVVEAIPLHMNQLFYNLLGNALKFTHPDRKPVIAITARAATQEEIAAHPNLSTNNNHTFISITDNGIGFDPQMANQLFTIFQRLHSRNQYEGTGIGLALCKRIVLAHGGAIWARGNPDQGSSFSLLLPSTQ
jgi:PAS domain S-box-containing protein